MTDEITMMALGKAGAAAVLAIAAVGSAIGSGTAGLSAVGAWKRAFAQDRAVCSTIEDVEGWIRRE